MSEDESMQSENEEENMSGEEQFDENASSDDSDKELQIAFKKGLLKDIVVESEQVTTYFANNKVGLEESLKSLKRNLPWYETLQVSVEPLVMPRVMGGECFEPEEDELKMENKCYRQTQAAVLKAIPLLHKNQIRTKRPDDFFAEMIKSDEHMKKVKENILTLKAIKEKSEQAKKQREARKFKKLADKEAQAAKRKEKLEYKEALQKSKKKFKLGQNDLKQNTKKNISSGGHGDDDDDDEDNEDGSYGGGGSKKTPKKEAATKGMYNKEEKTVGKKRKFKNEKYGFGGQKKRSKFNTVESLNDFDNKASISKKRPMKNKNKRNSRVKNKAK